MGASSNINNRSLLGNDMRIDVRNRDVASAYLRGTSLKDLASLYDLRVGHVRQIIHATLILMTVQAQRPLPENLTLSAAVDVASNLDIWPDTNHATEIWNRRAEITSGSRHPAKTLRDLRRWIDSL